MKPDRYEWLHAEQKTIANEGTEVRRAWRMYRHMSGGALVGGAVLSVIVALTPNHPNGAIQLRYFTPVCVLLALGSAAILWKWRVRHPSIRFAAWMLLCLAVPVVGSAMLA
jgi:hypothetical protein